MGFKWGQELLKAKQIIKELKQENAELSEYIRELRKKIVELEDSL